jgi:hypothetical protein
MSEYMTPVMLTDSTGYLSETTNTCIKVAIAVTVVVALTAAIVLTCGAASISAAPILFTGYSGMAFAGSANVLRQRSEGLAWEEIDYGEAALSSAKGFAVGAASTFSGFGLVAASTGAGIVGVLTSGINSAIDQEQFTAGDAGIAFISSASGAVLGSLLGGDFHKYGNIWIPLTGHGSHILKVGVVSGMVGGISEEGIVYVFDYLGKGRD